MRYISRDPFARTTLYSTAHTGTWETCDWCGNKSRDRYGNERVYSYHVERDDRPGRHDHVSGVYCSVSCMRAYMGE